MVRGIARIEHRAKSLLRMLLAVVVGTTFAVCLAGCSQAQSSSENGTQSSQSGLSSSNPDEDTESQTARDESGAASPASKTVPNVVPQGGKGEAAMDESSESSVAGPATQAIPDAASQSDEENAAWEAEDAALAAEGLAAYLSAKYGLGEGDYQLVADEPEHVSVLYGGGKERHLDSARYAGYRIATVDIGGAQHFVKYSPSGYLGQYGFGGLDDIQCAEVQEAHVEQLRAVLPGNPETVEVQCSGARIHTEGAQSVEQAQASLIEGLYEGGDPRDVVTAAPEGRISFTVVYGDEDLDGDVLGEALHDYLNGAGCFMSVFAMWPKTAEELAEDEADGLDPKLASHERSYKNDLFERGDWVVDEP